MLDEPSCDTFSLRGRSARFGSSDLSDEQAALTVALILLEKAVAHRVFTREWVYDVALVLLVGLGLAVLGPQSRASTVGNQTRHDHNQAHDLRMLLTQEKFAQ